MVARFQQMKTLIMGNIKTLLAFEVVYRIVGVMIFFPLARNLVSLAIWLSPYDYITNPVMIDFAMRPMTIVLTLVLLVFLGVYVAIELVALSVLYHHGYHEKTITITDLLKQMVTHLNYILKRSHIIAIALGAIIFLVIQLNHFSGIASTLSIPDYILDNLDYAVGLALISGGMLLLMFAVFIRHIHSFNALTLEGKSLKESRHYRQAMTPWQWARVVVEFLVLNLIVNGILYLTYIGILALISGVVSLTQGQEVVLGVILTVFYTVYLAIALIALSVLVPINYAWMSTWYHHEAAQSLSAPKNSPGDTILKILRRPRRKALLGTFIVFVFAINATSVYSSVTSSRGFFDAWRAPEIIAHRGASWDAPENTIPAFEEAINQNADAIEFDVHLTSDGVPIVMHDATVGRTTDATANTPVAEMTYEEVRALDAGSWFSDEFEGTKVPTLEAAIEVIDPHARIFLEMKNFTDAATAEVYNIIEEKDVADNTVLMSFSSHQLREMKDYDEDIETLYLMTTFFGSISSVVDQEHVDHFGFEGYMTLENPHYIDSIHHRDKHLSVWTINDESRLRDLTILGVDGIITDRPILAREVAYSQPSNPLINQILRDLFDN